MNKISKIYSAGLAVAAALAVCTSCSDTWDDHYNMKGASDKTLWQQISENQNLSDFAEVLQKTKLTRSHQLTSVTYAEILDGSQSYTVWAPQNGTFNKDSLVALLSTYAGDSAVEKAFVNNHIANYIYSVQPNTAEQIKLKNTKIETLTAQSFGSANLVDENIAAKNGVMHVTDKPIPFYSNIYEYICSHEEYSHFADFLRTYQKDSLDPSLSVLIGADAEGNYIYSDSVMIEKNMLLDAIGYLNTEDSVYWAILPTNAAWEATYAKIAPYYQYNVKDKNFVFDGMDDAQQQAYVDSLQDLRTKLAIINDLVYNVKQQRDSNGEVHRDSLYATSYSLMYNLITSPHYAVYHKYMQPFEGNGPLAFTNYGTAGLDCSNGRVFPTSVWPYTIYDVFCQPIKVEAESQSNIEESKYGDMNSYSMSNDSVSFGYMDFSATGTNNATITYTIPNTLSCSYDIYVVMLPQVAINENTTDFRPCKFKATVSYMNEKGQTKSVTLKNLYNDPDRIDTVKAGSIDLPVCGYGFEFPSVKVELATDVRSTQVNQYSKEMLIDFIYFVPRKD